VVEQPWPAAGAHHHAAGAATAALGPACIINSQMIKAHDTVSRETSGLAHQHRGRRSPRFLPIRGQLPSAA
jgi:hypothetical protein